MLGLRPDSRLPATRVAYLPHASHLSPGSGQAALHLPLLWAGEGAEAQRGSDTFAWHTLQMSSWFALDGF